MDFPDSLSPSIPIMVLYLVYIGITKTKRFENW